MSGGTFSFREKAQRTLGSKEPRQVPAFFKGRRTQDLFSYPSKAFVNRTATGPWTQKSGSAYTAGTALLGEKIYTELSLLLGEANRQ